MNVQTKRAPIVLPKKKEKQTKKQAIIRFITPFTHLIERKKQEHKRKRTSKFHLIGSQDVQMEHFKNSILLKYHHYLKDCFKCLLETSPL